MRSEMCFPSCTCTCPADRLDLTTSILQLVVGPWRYEYSLLHTMPQLSRALEGGPRGMERVGERDGGNTCETGILVEFYRVV